MADNENLASIITDGIATEKEQGVALKAIRTAMSVSMAEGLKGIMAPSNRLAVLADSAIDLLEARWQAESSDMSVKSLMRFIESIQSKQIQILDLYRKTIQGHDIISGDTLSEDEKMVLKLFKSFKTNEEKAKFLNLCKEALNGNNA